MQKPKNYDNTPVQGEFTPVELGGHKLIIKQVSETKSKTGKPMIVVLFDFAPEDKQTGYFTERFKNDIRPDKKWPNQATQYILLEDDRRETSKGFKTFCTCAEHSNVGFKISWEANWGAQFKNKRIGGVFGEQLDYYNDKETKKRILRWFTSFDKAPDAAVPEITESQAYKNHKNGYPAAASSAGDGFMYVPDSINDEELPFN